MSRSGELKSCEPEFESTLGSQQSSDELSLPISQRLVAAGAAQPPGLAAGGRPAIRASAPERRV